MTISNPSHGENPQLKIGTFLQVPLAKKATKGQIAILGLPFDCGTNPTRIGSRQGPSSFRAMSSEVRPFYPPLADVDPRLGGSVVDLGDVSVTPADVASLNLMEEAVYDIVRQEAVPLCVGGDGTVTLAVLRALARKFKDLVLIHIDAHTDCYPGTDINTGTTFTLVAQEQLVDVKRSFHIGARGTMHLGGAYDFTRSTGFNVIEGDEVRRRGIADTVSTVRDVIGARPVHLCFDMDYFDPSAAPGVATPTWGGPSVAEAFDLLHGLSGMNIVGVDINTLSPPHDVAGMTAMLAAHTALIAMHLVQIGMHNASADNRDKSAGDDG